MALPPVSIGKGNFLAPSVGGNKWYDPGGLFNKRADKNNVADKIAAYVASPLSDYSGGADNIIQPANEEALLAELPKYGGAGGSQQAGEYYAGQDFFKMFGRNPTASELASLSPYYQSGDPNIANQSGGRSAIAQYYQTQLNDPSRLEAIKQKKLQAEAPKFYAKINGMFNQSLGRDATESEKQHFGSMLATGTIDEYTVEQFLSTLPENVKKQDEEFRASLNNTLQSQDSQYYQEQIAPALQAMATKQGRSLDSSGVNNSLALAAQQQNRQRESYLSNLTAQQYGNSQNLAQQNYQQAYGTYQNLQDYNRQRSYGLQDQQTARTNNMSDYAIQSQAYNNYLAKYGKRNNGMSGAASGAASGALLGTSIMPGWGTAIGAVGGGLAGYFGSQG